MSRKRNENRKHHANRRRHVPAVMAYLKIAIDGDDLKVTLDDAPYPSPEGWEHLGRDAVRRLIDFVAVERGPVRVQVTESDGTVYTDIATPPDFESVTSDLPSSEAQRPQVMNELIGREYLAGEIVDVAVVVHELEADRQGRISLILPSSVLSRLRKDIVLLGRTSGTINVMHRS